jgi:hypothetical protein
MNQDDLHSAVENHFKVPARIQKLINQASYDLYFGPIGEEDYPGFTSATDEISDWMNDNVYDVWYDDFSGGLYDTEPEGWEDDETGEWIEPEWSEIYSIDVNEVKAILTGDELAKYV